MRELEDYSWFPKFLRNFQTDFIGFVAYQFNMYEDFVTYISSLSLSQKPITDLCSGTGKPAIYVFERTKSFSRLILTDKYPNNDASNIYNATYENSSIDVLNIKFRSDTYYTMFNSFHHFTDEEKKLIVKSVLDVKAEAFFVEELQPTVICLFKVLFVTLIGTIFVTPFIHPLTFKRFVFTYLIPINIITISIDGVLSVLKSGSLKYFQNLFSEFGTHVEVFSLKKGFTSLIVIRINPHK